MKKRFFNAVVAAVAAMSLSVSAFAETATPGLSDLPGWSGVPGASDAAVTVPVDKSYIEVGSEDGVLVAGPKGAFGSATSVTLAASIASGDEIPGDMAKAVEDAVYNVLDNWKPRLVTQNFSVNTVVRVSLYNQDNEEFEPTAALDLTIPTDKKSNIVAYVGDNGKVEWYEIKDDNNKLMTISTKHFSDYYFLTLDATVVDTLLGIVGPEDPDETDDSNNGGGNNGGSTESTSQTAAPEETTTTAAPTTSDNNGGSNSGDDTTAAPSDTDSNGTGDSNNGSGDSNNGSTDGTGSDKNQATGVVLAVVPAAIAAAAVVISKKRK